MCEKRIFTRSVWWREYIPVDKMIVEVAANSRFESTILSLYFSASLQVVGRCKRIL